MHIELRGSGYREIGFLEEAQGLKNINMHKNSSDGIIGVIADSFIGDSWREFSIN